MALTPGTRLGVYEVIAQIGEGGMGQVYRARDTKLRRDVALKVLPDSFASDHDRFARFTREAQTLASLNHPNIAHIHGLEECGGVRALVMELVEGDDLSQRIARGAIPLDEALPVAKQIAEAIEAAHAQGIVHRDLKPANIKVRSDGTVKVLDFGLAKAVEGAGQAGGNLSQSPTITSPAVSAMGVILGTMAYMSPEQARGRPVDKRTDIWAFGAVLYEMLTGAPPFHGEDTPEVIAAVLKTAPNWSTLPAGIPQSIVTLIKRCLEKDRQSRVGDIAVARFVLADHATLGISPTSAASHRAMPRAAWARTLPWAVAGASLIVAGVLLMLWAPWRAEQMVDHPLVRLDVDLGPDVSLPVPTGAGSSIAISPDGTRLAYISGAPTRLFTRRLDQPNATELPGTQGALGPFFSADGLWVGFFSGGKANKISVEDGAMVSLGDGAKATASGGSWGEDGSFLVSNFKGLVRFPGGGGPPETVLELGSGELVTFPQILPGGNAILFSVVTALDVNKFTIEVLTLADRRRKVVARGGSSPRYLPTSSGVGHLVYVNNATLFAVPFDLDTLKTRGTAVPVLNDVAHDAVFSVGEFDFSRTGTLVYRRISGGAPALTTALWVDSTGRKEPLRAKPGLYGNPRISPDGTKVALWVGDGGSSDVWVHDQREAMTRLTHGGTNYYPTWSPDGHYVVFWSAGNGLFHARADGASQPLALTESKAIQFPGSFTPDGKRLAYVEIREHSQIWSVPLEDQGGRLKAGTPEPFLKSNFNDEAPAFSPDGRWLAYHSSESGKNEVYVRAFSPPSSGQSVKWLISNSGGAVPRWSRSGHELVYQSGDQIMAAGYTVNGDRFVAEKPRVWIAKLGAAVLPNATMWDLAPDGKRLVVLAPVESAQDHHVVFLQNFFDDLRRRVPLGK